MNFDGLETTLGNAQSRLLSHLTDSGYWQGRLSSSALATAIAAFALSKAGKTDPALRGLRWLAANQNPDAGWGDTPRSPSNFTTTLLCFCALSAAGPEFSEVSRNAEEWLAKRAGGLDSKHLADFVLQSYGNDHTFSAPILAMCQIAGKLDEQWERVPQLPFELAILPHQLYKWLRLPVVSYALPALIAIGIARHRNLPSKFGPARAIRNLSTAKALRILRAIQPESGGYLEAQPLTGFVAMSLCAAGLEDHPTTRACIAFLENTIRSDGSWPIDVNLSTWLTSLSVCALENDPDGLQSEQERRIRQYLLATQWSVEHPFTHGEPGGWGWTHASGGVPDADDTAAALLALAKLDPEHSSKPAELAAMQACHENGIRWLLNLQNRDGGIPTFCKGWGKLPFDRSCPDLTAHAIQALSALRGNVSSKIQKRIDRFVVRALEYLEQHQRDDGAWEPLWFGNQQAPDHKNPLYGTVCVLTGLRPLAGDRYPRVGQMIARCVQWLEAAQDEEGGWGGAPGTPATVEETALAVGALAEAGRKAAAMRGAQWLVRKTAQGTQFPSTPIGLYFASLWYSEELYPLIFTVRALSACRD